MKLINRTNFWSIYCKCFTIIALFGAVLDIADRQTINYSQWNLLAIAVICLLGVGALSLMPRLETLSPLASIALLYAAALLLALFLTWLTGFYAPVNPGGYLDMARSFTIPYVIGAGIYCHHLKREIRKQNEELQTVRGLMGK